jgi:hypothetical protein
MPKLTTASVRGATTPGSPEPTSRCGRVFRTRRIGWWVRLVLASGTRRLAIPAKPVPTLPQATWFFFGSPPTDLPLAPAGPGQGWFAATLDATTWQALAIAPLAPPVLLLNQFAALRRRIWPWVQKRLQISCQPIEENMSDWHEYQLFWRKSGCEFWVDGRLSHHTPFSPRGPLGFVCWIDNQFMVATANGRFRWGTLPVAFAQFLEVENLQIEGIEA